MAFPRGFSFCFFLAQSHEIQSIALVFPMCRMEVSLFLVTMMCHPCLCVIFSSRTVAERTAQGCLRRGLSGMDTYRSHRHASPPLSSCRRQAHNMQCRAADHMSPSDENVLLVVNGGEGAG